MRNIGIFSILYLCIWGVLAYRPIFVNVALVSDILIDHPVASYNEALRLAKDHAYTGAHALLEGLRLPGHESDVYELYGDVLYLSSGSRDDIHKLYTLAYDVSHRDRLREKISLLDAPDPSPQNSIVSGETRVSSAESEGYTGKILSDTIDALEKQESEKYRYIYPPNGLPRPDSEQLSDIRRFLDDGIERVDW